MELVTAPSKTQQVADLLATQIQQGKIAPGTRLRPVRELAKQFGVSSKVVVTAFERLEQQGMLSRQARRGVFVRETAHQGVKMYGLLTQYQVQDIEPYFEAQQRTMQTNRACCIHIPFRNGGPVKGTMDWARKSGISGLFVDIGPWIALPELRSMCGDLPVCFIHHWQWPVPTPPNSVTLDLRAVYRQAFKHLLDKGHKRIAIVGPHPRLFKEHAIDVLPAAEGLGLGFTDESLNFVSLPLLRKAPEAVENLFLGSNPVTALVGVSDFLLLNFHRELRRRLPQIAPLTCVGNYDTPWSRQPGEAFSSFQVDYDRLWQSATQLLKNPPPADGQAERHVPRFIERSTNG